MPPAPPGSQQSRTPTRKGGLPGGSTVWIIGLAVALGAGAFLLWRSRQSAASAGSGTSPTSADTTGYDQGAGELGTLQSEIGDLQSSEAQQKVQVPNVVGMTQSVAYSRISAAGLKPAGAPVQPGKTLTVNAQAPAAGALAVKGSTVTLQSTVHAAAKPKPKKKKKTGLKEVA